MPRKIPYIDRIISTYGSYSKPFINWALEMEKIPPCWKHYFRALKFHWRREYFSSLDEVEKGLLKCKNNKTLYYLLLIQKLSLLSKINSKEGDFYYKKLKKEFPYIPSYARNIASSSLLHYYTTNFFSNLPKFRVWSNSYYLFPSSQVFIFLGKAREEIKRENIREAISYYFKALRISLSIPHPTAIIDSLNDSSWYLKEKHPKFSLLLAKKAVYYSAWYREDPAYDFAVLDTLFEIQKINNDPSIYETSEIIEYYYEFLPNSQGKHTKEHYKKLYESSKKLCFNSESYYKNNEIKRLKLKKEERKILILSTFMSLYNRKVLFPFITKNLKNILKGTRDFKDLSKFADNNLEIKKFTWYMLGEAHPFLKARMDLARIFLESLPPPLRERFINFYISLNEEEREFIDTFVRNYARYDRDWEIKIYSPEEITPFIKKFQLKELPSTLAYFSFEKRVRKKFRELITIF